MLVNLRARFQNIAERDNHTAISFLCIEFLHFRQRRWHGV